MCPFQIARSRASGFIITMMSILTHNLHDLFFFGGRNKMNLISKQDRQWGSQIIKSKTSQTIIIDDQMMATELLTPAEKV